MLTKQSIDFEFGDMGKQDVSDARWWEVAKKFQGLWVQVKDHITNLRALPEVVKGTEAIWNSLPPSGKQKSGLTKVQAHFKDAWRIRTTIDKYLPQWLVAENKIQQASGSISEYGEMGFMGSVVVSALSLSALGWVAFRGLTILKEIYAEKNKAQVELKLFEALKQKELTSDQIISVLPRRGDGANVARSLGSSGYPLPLILALTLGLGGYWILSQSKERGMDRR